MAASLELSNAERPFVDSSKTCAHSMRACTPGSPFANTAASTSFCAARSTSVSSCEAMLANLKHVSENKIAATAVNHCTPPSNQRRCVGMLRGTLTPNTTQPQIMEPGFHNVISICPSIHIVRAAAATMMEGARECTMILGSNHHAKPDANTTPTKRAASDA